MISSCCRWAGLLAIALALGGCVGSPITASFNPEFLSDVLGLGTSAASVPGDAPAVLVLIENHTGRWIDAQLSWRVKSDVVDERLFTIPNGSELGEVLICPVEEITLGDVGNLSAIGAAVRLGNQGPNDPFVEVEPFGVLLKDGVNYECGDRITFSVRTSSATASGYQVFAFIQRAEAP
ncbi:MAG: hypothetical protein KKB50_14115 [Planctomycetes bacterium]|nr:hypothetical protein [Planctomycetota bacterium]